MTRPTILDMDVVVVPIEATIEMECRVDHEDCTTPDAAKSAFRDMLSASPYLTAWDDVRKYVEWLERELAVEKTRSVGDWANQRENDYITIKRYEEKARAEAAEARIAELERSLATCEDDRIDRIEQCDRMANDWADFCASVGVPWGTHEAVAHVLISCADAAETRIAELEKRLADAERVIEPFADAADLFKYSLSEGVCIDVYLRNLRAARAYMEMK